MHQGTRVTCILVSEFLFTAFCFKKNVQITSVNERNEELRQNWPLRKTKMREEYNTEVIYSISRTHSDTFNTCKGMHRTHERSAHAIIQPPLLAIHHPENIYFIDGMQLLAMLGEIDTAFCFNADTSRWENPDGISRWLPFQINRNVSAL